MKKYFVTRTSVKIYYAWAESPERAEEMVRRKDYRTVGSEDVEGWGELIPNSIEEREAWSTAESPPTKGGNDD